MTTLQRPRGDDGLSITELVVTMLVMSIIIVTTASLTIGFQRSAAENVLRQQQIDDGRFSVEVMSKSLRTAVRPRQVATQCTVTECENAFMAGGASAVQFHANLNNPNNSVGPSRVTYTVLTSGPDAGQLVEEVLRPDSNVPTGGRYQYCNPKAAGASAACKSRHSQRVLAKGVQVEAGRPVFRYYAKGGTVLDPGAGTLAGTAMRNVVAVEVQLKVQAPGAYRPQPTTYVQRIMLPNTEYLIREETGP